MHESELEEFAKTETEDVGADLFPKVVSEIQERKKGKTCEITRFLREILDPAQRFPIHPLGRQHFAGGGLVHDVGHDEERIARQEVCEFLAGRCFPDIIALIFELSAHDCDRVLQIESLWQEGRGAEEEGEVGQVGFDRGRDAGELDLDGDLPAVFEDGAMHLADRGGGDRCTVKLGKQVGLPVGAELVAEDFVHLPVGHVVGVGLDLVQHLFDFGGEHVVVCGYLVSDARRGEGWTDLG